MPTMTVSLRMAGYLSVALAATVASAWVLVPYFVAAPQVLIAPALVIACCVFVFALEGPTREKTRALLENDASLQIAVWDYSVSAWPEVVRTAPSPGGMLNVATTAITTTFVTLVAGVSSNDARALVLGATWAVVWACGLQAYFTSRDATLAKDPNRRLRMTRGIVMLGERLYLVNPEPAVPELATGAYLHDCVATALPAAGGAGGAEAFAGTLTFTCLLLSRNSRRRMDYRFLVPAEHAHDVARVVAAYTDIAAPNRADTTLTLPKGGTVTEAHAKR